jgi:hypothetical protein
MALPIGTRKGTSLKILLGWHAMSLNSPWVDWSPFDVDRYVGAQRLLGMGKESGGGPFYPCRSARREGAFLSVRFAITFTGMTRTGIVPPGPGFAGNQKEHGFVWSQLC